MLQTEFSSFTILTATGSEKALNKFLEDGGMKKDGELVPNPRFRFHSFRPAPDELEKGSAYLMSKLYKNLVLHIARKDPGITIYGNPEDKLTESAFCELFGNPEPGKLIFSFVPYKMGMKDVDLYDVICHDMTAAELELQGDDTSSRECDLVRFADVCGMVESFSRGKSEDLLDLCQRFGVPSKGYWDRKYLGSSFEPVNCEIRDASALGKVTIIILRNSLLTEEFLISLSGMYSSLKFECLYGGLIPSNIACKGKVVVQGGIISMDISSMDSTNPNSQSLITAQIDSDILIAGASSKILDEYIKQNLIPGTK